MVTGVWVTGLASRFGEKLLEGCSCLLGNAESSIQVGQGANQVMRSLDAPFPVTSYPAVFFLFFSFFVVYDCFQAHVFSPRLPCIS